MQKRFRSHGNEPPKHSNREECDNSTVEGDLHTFRPERTSGRELTNRRENTTEDRRQTEVRIEVFVLCGVVTETFTTF
jgi:hypothetical protein